MTGAAQFAERAALFVIRNEQAIGWRECEAGDPANFELIGGVSLPLSADTLLGRAAHSRSTWNGAPGSNSEDSLLIDQLGGDPQTVAAVPLVVRGKVVAVLYADSVSHDSNAVNVDALELLARVAAMAVNLAAAPRAVPEQQPDEPEAVTPTAVAEPAYPPEIEPQTTEVIAAPAVEEVSTEPTAEHVPEVIAAPAVEEVSTEPTAEHVPEVIASPAVEEVSAQREPGPLARPEEAAAETSAPKPITAAPAIETAAPSFTTQYAAPLGSARRYGVSEPDLPIDVGEEERRLHNDARRFARLLVSEIKLYNEPKVKDGRSNGDLYDRLREDIDRSRQMYNKRVAPPVAARHDYFHQELVNTLAEGDPAKLGDSYPGAAVAVN